MSTPEIPGSGEHVDADLLAALSLEQGLEQDAGQGAEHGPEHELDGLDAAARAHVQSCATCTAEVDALRETLALVVAARVETFTAPPASVWAAVSAGLDEEPTEQDVPAHPAGVTSLDDRRRRVPTWWVAAAAAVALLAGVGIGTQVVGDREEEAPAPTVLASTQLASLDDVPQARGGAEVRRVDDRVQLHVEASDLGGPDGTREVWLINVDGTRMVSLGLLGAGETGEFDFPERLLEQGYRVVDVSYEPDDGDPAHSGTSLARGTIEG